MKNRIRFSIMAMAAIVGLACQLIPSVTTSGFLGTPTQTPSPSPSPTETLLPTKTFTPTPLPVDVSLDLNEDGSSLFIDNIGGYSLNLPDKWLAFTFDLQGIEAVTQKIGSKNPQLIEIMLRIDELEDNGYRLIAFDTKAGHSRNGYLPNLTVQIYTDSESRSYHPNDIADYWMHDIKQEMPGTEVAVSHNRIGTGGVFTSLIFDNTVSMENNNKIPVRETIVIFQAYKALTIIYLSAPRETAYEVDKAINNLFQTIKGMRP